MNFSNPKQRTAAVLVTATLVGGGLSACGGSSTKSGGSSSKAGGSGTKLAFVEGVTGDNFYDTEACGAKQAAKAAGATLSVSGPGQYDPAQQASVAQTAAGSGAKALIIAPTSPTVLEPPVRQAKQRGMKIVAVGNTLQDPSLADATVLTNNTAGGKLAGQALRQMAHASGPVLILAVEAGNPAIGDRVEGFRSAASAAGKFSPLPVQYDANKATSASTIVRSTLAAHPNLAGIFATDLPGLTGAAQGLKSSGKSGKIPLVGYDASPTEIKLLKSGEAQALVAQPAKQEGAQAAQAALSVINGHSVPKVKTLENQILTTGNLSKNQGDIYTGAC